MPCLPLFDSPVGLEGGLFTAIVPSHVKMSRVEGDLGVRCAVVCGLGEVGGISSCRGVCW